MSSSGKGQSLVKSADELEHILNETWYPDDFAKKTRELVDQEYPYPYCYSGWDRKSVV